MTPKDTAQHAIDELGLTVTWEFIPKKQPEEKHPRLHWQATLTKNGRGMTVPYAEGCAHITNYAELQKLRPYARTAAIKATCETGTLQRFAAWSGGCSPTNARQPDPSITELLYCLVMDAHVLDCPTYEQFAREYGYDEDSRTGEKVYQQCLTQSLQLRSLIGETGIQQLQIAFQDY